MIGTTICTFRGVGTWAFVDLRGCPRSTVGSGPTESKHVPSFVTIYIGYNMMVSRGDEGWHWDGALYADPFVYTLSPHSVY